jgi:hypothetical protein
MISSRPADNVRYEFRTGPVLAGLVRLKCASFGHFDWVFIDELRQQNAGRVMIIVGIRE